MRWSPADLADAVYEGFLARAEADNLEQAVYGFDALAELGLHPLIQESLLRAGYGVWPETRYPCDWIKAKRNEGMRCDIVLTPDKRAIRDPRLKDTLFDSDEAVDAENAYWLEVKTVAQHEKTGPFRRYSAELLAPVANDVKKLWSDSIIRHAGLLLVLLTESREIAEHDILAWHRKCLDRGYPVAAPAIRGFKITERIGNAWCAIALFGIRGV